MTENTELALLGSNNVIQAAQEYTKAMSMPADATASVLRTMQAARALREMVLNQSQLEPATRRKMLTAKEGIGDQLLASIDAYCMANTFPYSFIAVIQQKIYPMALGLNLKMLADPRIFRGWVLVSKEIVTSEKNYVCRITKRAVFANGEVYEATGVADLIEVMQRNPKATPAIVEMKAETRAERRACLKALPMMGMIVEDSTDSDEAQAGETQF